MLPRVVASRYAEALFGLAQQQQNTDAWEEQLRALITVFDATPELYTVLTHPEITQARKAEILQQAFGGKVAPEILNTLQLLIRRGHDPDVRTLYNVYHELWDAARQVVPVTVTSVVPLTEAQRSILTEALSQRLNATIRLEPQLDPEIIAGLVLQMGDRVIDASARTMLENLREAIRSV
jgi:F-type H+-transporting ATPase subunit delta